MKEYDSVQYRIPLPKEVYDLNRLFRNKGYNLFAVGGVVRDFMYTLNHATVFSPKDVDLATEASPETVVALLNSPEAKDLGVKCFPKGESFGVISAIINDEEYEIATFREEWYDPDNGDGRRPDQVKFSTPAKDAARRDLTINALFYHLESQEIRDYNLNDDGSGQGLWDITNQVVRPVGNPHDRFREDKLRVLRLCRFFARFNSNPIGNYLDAETFQAIEKFRNLQGVSKERIANEFMAGLEKAKCPGQYIEDLADLRLLEVMFPNLILTAEWVNTRNIKAALAWLLRKNDPVTVRKALNNLTYSNEIVDRVEFLLKFWAAKGDEVVPLLKQRDLYKQLKPKLQEQAWKTLVADLQEFCGRYGGRPAHFLAYEPVAKASDFIHLQGAAISKAMLEYEKKMYAASEAKWRLANEDV